MKGKSNIADINAKQIVFNIFLILFYFRLNKIYELKLVKIYIFIILVYQYEKLINKV